MEHQAQPRHLAWEVEVPLLTNRFMLAHVGSALAALMGLLAVVFGAAFGWANGWEGVGQALLLTLGAGLFMALVSAFTLGVFLGNRSSLAFHLDDSGIRMESLSRRAGLAHRAALLAGILARNPGVTAAGVAGMVTETTFVDWDEVQGLRPHPGSDVVTIRRRFFPDLHVYCPPGALPEVLAFLQERAPSGERP